MLTAEDVIVEELRGPNEVGSLHNLFVETKRKLLGQGELVIKRYK